MARKRKTAGGVVWIVFGVAFLGLVLLNPLIRKRIAAAKEARYSISLGEDFNAAASSRDDLGISVVIAVDVSGSMDAAPASGGPAKFRQAAKALSQVAGVLERLVSGSDSDMVVKVGVLKFSTGAETVLPLTTLDEKGLRKLGELVADPFVFRPSGSTAIGSAIERGVRMLLDSGTIMRSLIIVTDGENTSGVEPSWSLSALYGNRNSATSPDFPVATDSILVSFIGFDIGRGYFDPFGRFGARVTSAADQAELTRALSLLLEADITKLEAADGF